MTDEEAMKILISKGFTKRRASNLLYDIKINERKRTLDDDAATIERIHSDLSNKYLTIVEAQADRIAILMAKNAALETENKIAKAISFLKKMVPNE